MTTPSNERFVRRALWANALFSLLCGALLILFSGTATALSDTLPAMAFILVGATLLPFSLVVALCAWRTTLRPVHVLLISSMDFAWVVGTLALGGFWPALFTSQGWTAAALVAFSVAVFCSAQLLGLRHVREQNSHIQGQTPIS